MPPIELSGIRVDAPRRCEARIRLREPDPAAVAAAQATSAADSAGGPVAASDPNDARPVVHITTVPLPADRGDFGSGVVEQLRDQDILVALVELDPGQAGTELCARQGIPRRIAPALYAPDAMQRTIHGQSGVQAFFTDHGRAFCLYVVLGSHARRHELAHLVDDVLAGIDISAV